MADTSRAEVFKVARLKSEVSIALWTISTPRLTLDAGGEIVEVYQSHVQDRCSRQTAD
jgi:hypothetical protein